MSDAARGNPPDTRWLPVGAAVCLCLAMAGCSEEAYVAVRWQLEAFRKLCAPDTLQAINSANGDKPTLTITCTRAMP